MACTFAGASSRRIATPPSRSSPMLPPTVSPMWAITTSAPARAIRRLSSGLKT